MAKIQLNIAPASKIINWSEEQEEIFEWGRKGKGHLLIRARAGCAKTSTLIEMVNRTKARRICVAAFNKNIALELQARLTGSNVKAATLHSIGFGYIKEREPMTQVDTTGKRARTLVSEALAGMSGEKIRRSTINVIARLCTWIRETIGDPDMLFAPEEQYQGIRSIIDVSDFDYELDEEESAFWTYGNIIKVAIEAVKLAKKPTLVIDFADMVFLPIALDLVQGKYDIVAVDEAQDMTSMQLQLAVKACRGRIVLVGDDKQAIYSFRGADVDCLDRLKAELEADELNLATTYRCAKRIVKAANAIVPDLKAQKTAPEGLVKENVSYDEMYFMVKPGDFILSRINAAMAEVYIELIKQGRKAYIRGSDFGKRALTLIEKQNCNQLPALKQALENWLKRKKAAVTVNPEDEDQAEVKKARLEDDVALINYFIDNAKNYSNLIKTISDSCADEPPRDAIILSTVHKAKGLESDNVWILGNTFMFEGTEEKNICYVAMTRARSKLYIVGCSMKYFLNLEAGLNPVITPKELAKCTTPGRMANEPDCFDDGDAAGDTSHLGDPPIPMPSALSRHIIKVAEPYTFASDLGTNEEDVPWEP